MSSPRSASARLFGNTPGVLALAAGLALLAACSGPRQIRGLPPLVRVSQLQALSEPPQMTVRVQNPNSVPLSVARLDLEFSIDGEPVPLSGEVMTFEIIAQSAEEVEIPITLDQPKSTRLAAGNIDDQPGWEISGRLVAAGGRNWPFRAAGLFYPIPGVAGAWRATTTDSGFQPQ